MKEVLIAMADGSHKSVPRLEDNQELPPIQECVMLNTARLLRGPGVTPCKPCWHFTGYSTIRPWTPGTAGHRTVTSPQLWDGLTYWGD